MFPNVRLMIAATLASVVALICGFGMFAVFRVSHDPFVRLPAATAPLQLVADNAAKSAAGFASGEPFDRRFQVKASPDAATQANAAAAAPELRGTSEPRVEPETAPAMPAQSAAAAPEEIPSPPPANQQNSRPRQRHRRRAKRRRSRPITRLRAIRPIWHQRPSRRRQLKQRPPMPVPCAPSPNTTTADPDQDIKSPVVSMPNTEPAPHAVIELAVNEPQRCLPRERTMLTAKPTGAASPAADRAHKTAAKKAEAHPRRRADTTRAARRRRAIRANPKRAKPIRTDR